MKELGRGNDGLGLVEVVSTHSSTTADETGTIIAHTPGFFSMYHSVNCYSRYIMYIRGKGEVFLVDRDNSVFSCSSLSFPARAEEEHLVDTLLDGVSRTNCMMSSSAILSGQELVEDKLPNGVRPRYLVYDIMGNQIFTV